jgi:2-keto-4-pentenoate hydratase/2-oxohepta-3-ene-1,7-dioic acid hydratase in catechol pathway
LEAAVRLVGVDAHGVTMVGRIAGEQIELLTDVVTFWNEPNRCTGLAPMGTVPMAEATLVPPVLPWARVICVGLNYRAHATEGSFTVPVHPTLFGRWTRSLSVGDAPVEIPVGEDGLDWEGEVMVWVGRRLSDARPDEAEDAVFGYSTFNDLTARRAQKLTSQWTLGKNADGSGPLGPVVPRAWVGDLRDGLRIRTRVNGVTVQDASTSEMIFDVGTILSLVSRTLTLQPGDLLATGTPEGVGYVRKPARLLGPGDTVEVEVEKLGVVRTPVVARVSA